MGLATVFRVKTNYIIALNILASKILKFLQQMPGLFPFHHNPIFAQFYSNFTLNFFWSNSVGEMIFNAAIETCAKNLPCSFELNASLNRIIHGENSHWREFSISEISLQSIVDLTIPLSSLFLGFFFRNSIVFVFELLLQERKIWKEAQDIPSFQLAW